jgi:hypothetical protein
MTFNLDVNDPNQVASPSYLEIDIGEPDKKALVFSGIAIPNWHIDDDSNNHHETAIVNLRYKVLAVDQATISVGLASIFNDDSTFLYATDEASLCVDDNSQELKLTVALAVRGSNSNLSRFGYQIVLTATTQTTGISGTIRMAKELVEGSGMPENQIPALFLMSAGTMVMLPPPPANPGFGAIVYNPLAYGVITGMTSAGDDFDLTYEIPGAPYNQDLVVQPQIGPLFPPAQPGQGAVTINQVSGPNPVRLTVADPSVTGVDFRVSRPGGIG